MSSRQKMLERLGLFYEGTLGKFLHSKASRFLSITVPFLLLILSFMFLSPRIGFTLFPASDEGIININIEAKTGTDQESLQKYIPDIEKVVSQYEELKVYYVTLSGNSIKVYVELIESKLREETGLKDVFTVEEEILA